MYQTLKKLIGPVSVSGREFGIAAVISEEIAHFVDEVKTDAMGNLICLRRGSDENAPATMLVAHMDEIGFIVHYIEDNGFLRVSPIGGIDYTAAANTAVLFENGTRGVLVPESDKKAGEAPKAEKCYIDIGADSRAAAERRVRVGDCCALVPQVTRLYRDRVCGRPLDDRIGCAVLLEIAKKLTAPVGDIYYVFSVQEEVGCRGARPAAFGIAPEQALVFDVTATGDTVGAAPMAVKLGEGVAIKIKDRSVICHAGLVAELQACAKEKGIKSQNEILPFGGTDTSAVQMTGLGCRAGALSIPCRYIHSGNEMIDLADAVAAVELAVAYLGEGV